METETHPGVAAIRRLQDRARILEKVTVHFRRAGLGDMAGLWADQDFAERLEATFTWSRPGTHWGFARVRLSVEFGWPDRTVTSIHAEFTDPHGYSSHQTFDGLDPYTPLTEAVVAYRDLHAPNVQSEWDN